MIIISITISDIAKLAGVSKGTVSRVINNNPTGMSDETRQRILDIIEQVGYVPNRMAGSIGNARTKMLGLIIPDIQNMFFPQMVRGAEDCASEHGYTLFLCNSDSDVKKEQQYLNAFLEKRVNGILINTCGKPLEERTIKSLKQSDIPIVLLDRKSNQFSNNPGVYINNSEAAFEGVSYLIQNGCEKILFLGGPASTYTTRERQVGYQRALSEAKIEVSSDLISFGEYTASSGHDRVLSAINNGIDFDAVFACSDMVAVGALSALREKNIDVPGDVSVMGFDNISISSDLSPSLTTMAQPIYEIGYQAAKRLIDCIENKNCDYGNICLQAKLVVRESTKNFIRNE